jgi:hypothetical protein
MGLVSWITTTGRKSQAASLIQQFFEISKRSGLFPGDPHWAANKLTELACNRVPALAQKRKGLVLAAAVLAVVVMEDELSLEDRDRCATALAGMLKAAYTERHLHSYEDQALLETARQVYEKFRDAVPDVVINVPPDAEQQRQQTGRDRERAMDELIKRMST